MTRKIGVLFVVISIIILTLLEGLLGYNGYFVNRGLLKSIAERKYVRDEIALEVEYLQKRLDTVWEIDELRDSALRLGYVVPGETVYYFSDNTGSMQKNSPRDSFANVDELSGYDRFTGISLGVLFVFSMIISAILCIVRGFFIYRKEKKSRGDDAEDN